MHYLNHEHSRFEYTSTVHYIYCVVGWLDFDCNVHCSTCVSASMMMLSSEALVGFLSVCTFLCSHSVWVVSDWLTVTDWLILGTVV